MSRRATAHSSLIHALSPCLPPSLPDAWLAMGLHKIVNQIGHQSAKARRKRAGGRRPPRSAMRFGMRCVSVPDSGVVLNGGAGAERGRGRCVGSSLRGEWARRAHRGQPPAPPRKPGAVPAVAATGALAAPEEPAWPSSSAATPAASGAAQGRAAQASLRAATPAGEARRAAAGSERPAACRIGGSAAAARSDSKQPSSRSGGKQWCK